MSAIANPATMATNTATEIMATSSSVRFLPPSATSPATATTGMPRMISWFQTLVTATARPTGRPEKPHALSIANEVATPAAAPPGATIESAVEASVTLVA